MKNPEHTSRCRGISRRSFLADTGMGFTGLALGALLFRDGISRADAAGTESWLPPDGRPHLVPRAKSVIWIFLCGGLSHMESFDVKPALTQYGGKSIEETPFADALKAYGKDVIDPNPTHQARKTIMALQTGYRPYGECGLVVSDWFSRIGECADDLAVVRSLWTIHNDHGAQLTWQTGRHPRELSHPTLGSWVSYGLGSLNENLPEFVVLGTPTGDCCGGNMTFGASYLGPEHAGVQLGTDPTKPLPFIAPPKDSMTPEEQRESLGLLGKLNRLAGIDYPDDENLRARIKSYELAFQMQSSVPETLQLAQESDATRQLYGIDRPESKKFGEQCLVARRLIERGVRFVQLFHGGGGGGAWDAHKDIKNNHTKLAAEVDAPVAGLLRDLKQRGLLDDTLVVFGTEFGRTPGAEGTGRDHHPSAFSAWMAGGGIKGGVTHGATDELGFNAVEDRRYVTDIHATVLQQLGLDARRLEVPGRKRLDMDFGRAITEIIA